MHGKRKTAQTASPNSHHAILLVAIVAFALGGFTTWLVMRQSGSAERRTVSTRGAANESPPDTSQMSPTQAALILGNWHYDRKRWPQAIASYEQAIQLGLDNPDIRTDLGNCYRFSGQPQKALEQYRIAQRQNPQHEQSLFNTATLYAQVLNDSAKAAEIAQEYVQRFPNGQSFAAAQQLLAGRSEHSDEQTSVAKWLNEQASPARK